MKREKKGVQGEPIFKNKEIREMFKTERLVGDNFHSEDYRDLLQNETLRKIFCNDEMIRSAEAFIKCNLNLAVSSQEAYIHRNTMIYRIEKIKRVIGLDLKQFEDSMIYINARKVFRIINLCQKCENCKHRR